MKGSNRTKVALADSLACLLDTKPFAQDDSVKRLENQSFDNGEDTLQSVIRSHSAVATPQVAPPAPAVPSSSDSLSGDCTLKASPTDRPMTLLLNEGLASNNGLRQRVIHAKDAAIQTEEEEGGRSACVALIVSEEYGADIFCLQGSESVAREYNLLQDKHLELGRRLLREQQAWRETAHLRRTERTEHFREECNWERDRAQWQRERARWERDRSQWQCETKAFELRAAARDNELTLRKAALRKAENGVAVARAEHVRELQIASREWDLERSEWREREDDWRQDKKDLTHRLTQTQVAYQGLRIFARSLLSKANSGKRKMVAQAAGNVLREFDLTGSVEVDSIHGSAPLSTSPPAYFELAMTALADPDGTALPPDDSALAKFFAALVAAKSKPSLPQPSPLLTTSQCEEPETVTEKRMSEVPESRLASQEDTSVSPSKQTSEGRATYAVANMTATTYAEAADKEVSQKTSEGIDKSSTSAKCARPEGQPIRFNTWWPQKMPAHSPAAETVDKGTARCKDNHISQMAGHSQISADAPSHTSQPAPDTAPALPAPSTSKLPDTTEPGRDPRLIGSCCLTSPAVAPATPLATRHTQTIGCRCPQTEPAPRHAPERHPRRLSFVADGTPFRKHAAPSPTPKSRLCETLLDYGMMEAVATTPIRDTPRRDEKENLPEDNSWRREKEREVMKEIAEKQAQRRPIIIELD